MSKKPEQVALRGNAKRDYLKGLDNALVVLSNGLVSFTDTYSNTKLEEYATANGWDLSQLPSASATFKILAGMIKLAQEQYRWFAWTDNCKNPQDNHGYFDEIGIHTESGLPWIFDIIKLADIKAKSAELLEQLSSYPQTFQSLEADILSGDVEANELASRVQGYHETAMRRRFLEKLEKSELITWKSSENMDDIFVATLVRDNGVSELINVCGIKYQPNWNGYECFCIDGWQEKDRQLFHRQDTACSLAMPRGFTRALEFHPNNAPWYILQSIGERFDSFRPVHVTRALLGPYESTYTPRPTLSIVPSLLREDASASVLRFTRRYAYAPNNREAKELISQVRPQDDWSDEFIVVDTKYSERVARSIAGTSVHIFQGSETR